MIFLCSIVYSSAAGPWEEDPIKNYEELLNQRQLLEEEYNKLLKENQDQKFRIEKNKMWIYILLSIIGLLILLLFIFICVKIFISLNEKNAKKEEVLIERVNKIFANSLINNKLSSQANDYGAPLMANYQIENQHPSTVNPDDFNNGQVDKGLYKPYPEEQM